MGSPWSVNGPAQAEIDFAFAYGDPFDIQTVVL